MSTTSTSSSTSPGRAIARFNALFFDLMDGYLHWKYRHLKAELFADLPDTVVDLGSGTGANFRYLRPGTEVIAVEPNTHMHAALRRRAAAHRLRLTIVGAGGERLPVDDGSVSAVISSLVLCTVATPEEVLEEIRRVLAPGGKFLCIEHVAAPPTTWLAALQRAVLRPWRWMFDGCHTHRDTASVLHEAGFSDVSVRRHTLPTMFLPIRPHIIATCTR